MFHYKIRSTAIFNLLLSNLLLILSACGGGGGGSSSSTNNNNGSGNQSSPSIVLAKSSLTMEAFAGEGKRYTGSVRVDLSSEVKKNLSDGKKLYFFLSQSNDAIATLDAEIHSNYGNLLINTYVLPAGNYQSTITVKGCYDQNCNDSFGQSSLQLTFNVLEKLSYSESSFTLVKHLDIAGETSELTLDFGSLLLQGSQWDVSVTYSEQASDWLTIDKRTENNQGIITLAGDVLSCDSYDATLTIDYTTSTGLTDSLYIPLVYQVTSSTPVAQRVYPKVHYSDKPLQFALRGCGLANLTSDNTQFTALNLLSVTPRSDSEIEVIASAINSAGQISAAFSEQTETPNSALLTIKEAANYSAQTIDLLADDSLEFKQSLFDADNDRLYFNNINGWYGFQYTENQWQQISAFNIDNANGIEISNDGTKLYVIYDQSLQIIDALSYQLIDELLLEQDGHGAFSSVKALNTGKLLLSQKGAAQESRVIHYDLEQASMQPLTLESVSDYQADILNVSADRSLVLLPVTAMNNSLAYFQFDTATEQQQRILYGKQDIDVFRFASSQNGQHIFTKTPGYLHINNLQAQRFTDVPRDITVNEFGESAFFADAKLSKDGSRLFALYVKRTYNMVFVREYDLSALNQDQSGDITEISTAELAGYFGAKPQLLLSHDEQTAFAFDRSLAVIPLK